MNLLFIPILFLSFVNSHKPLELRSLKYSSVNKTFLEYQDYGSQGLHNKTNSDSLKVYYFNDTIRVFANNKLIKFRYTPKDSSDFPCECLAIFKDKKIPQYKKYHLNQDSLLFLPIPEFGQMMSLLIVNINSGEFLPMDKKKDYFIFYTYLDWFVFNESSGILTTTNSLDLDGKTIVRYFKISNNIAVYKGYKAIRTNYDIYLDQRKMKSLIKRVMR